jgi:hypothetical protein
MDTSFLPEGLIWGLIPRFVGVLHVLAFASILPQLPLLLGSDGLMPAARRLSHIRRDFPGIRRFFEYPTALWLWHSDRAIRLLPWVGVGCGLLAIVGGKLAFPAMLLAWWLWLSIESAALIFPWDTMLQEVGFLALFLPSVPMLPEVQAAELPSPLVTFMFRWLVLRLMWGFAKLKFIGSKKDDALYMRGFFIWMPSPSPLAWLAHHAPQWVLKNMLYFMFVAEVIAPLLGFFVGVPRLIAFGLLVGLMLGIMVTGNWGFFNLGYMLMCVCLLDSQASIFDWGTGPYTIAQLSAGQLASHAVLVLMFVTSLFYLVVCDSWVGRTIMHWPFDDLVHNRAWARGLLRYLRALAPFRIVNGYGVFPPNSVPALRIVTQFEGSDDGVSWKPYLYKYVATRPQDRPVFVAPHHPRIDMAIVYAGACVYDASFYASLIGDGTPYAAYTGSSWPDRFAQALLRGDEKTLRVLQENPFPDGPPRFVRGSGMAMVPTSLAEQRETGNYWRVRRVGTVVPARGREEWLDALNIPEPETFHPDWVGYKRRAAPLQAIVAAFASGEDPDAAILVGSDLYAHEVDTFWTDVVPFIQRTRGDYAQHALHAEALKQRYGMETLKRFERILERFVWLLRQRTERHHFADALPKIPLKSNFRYHMLMQEAVTDGRDAYLAMLDKPALLAERAASSSDGTQLWALTMLRHDLMMSHVRAFRWYSIGKQNHALGIAGLFEYYPLLASVVPPEEVFVPDFEKLPDGEFKIHGFDGPEEPKEPEGPKSMAALAT